MIGTPLDYGVIILYFLLITLFGSYFGRFTKTTKDFFLAGQKFSWWLISFSCVASLVGSYSFVKYSEAAFTYGLSGTQAYLNDWWWVPIFMFAWLPVIYYGKVVSIPEYFQKRFDRRTRDMATLTLLLYMTGYIGINLLTLAVALKTMLGWPVMVGASLIAVIVAIYCTAGGQTSVIMTDLFQAFLLLVAGLGIFFLGVWKLGGFGAFWHGLPTEHRYGLSHFNEPATFNFIGVFWQDAIANSAAFWFMNQGILMRFMSAKSIGEARKAMWVTVLFLMPVAALAVSGAGLVGRAMIQTGLLPADTQAKEVFVKVTYLLMQPGVFGFVIAALISALMSTTDTLVNAVSCVVVNDIWRPYVVPGAPDRYYLNVGRVVSVLAAFVGVLLVPVFSQFKTIYGAHAAFTAAVTPPMVIVILLGSLWKRFTSAAAFWTLLGGLALLLLSLKFDAVIAPFDHGVPREGYFLMRSLFGLAASLLIAVVVSRFTRPKPAQELVGLTFGTEVAAREHYKETVEL